MSFSAKQVIGLSVFTQSGACLGKVRDFILSESEHLVEKYVVSMWPLARRPLFVGRLQVKQILPDKMIVEDALLKEVPLNRKAVAPKPQEAMGNAVTASFED